MKTTLLCLLFSALGLADARLGYAAEFKPCQDADRFPEFEHALCAEATVPLTAERAATSSTIKLFLRKFPAASSSSKGTVWLIAGGPGESGASLYPFLPLLHRSFPGFDLIVPDHRGTGFSTRLCPKEESAESPGGFTLEGAEWGTCYQSLNAAPEYARAFSVTNAARDLASLLQAFKGPKPTYIYGVSYGTQLVLRLLSMGSPAIDGVILDSLVPPEERADWDLSHRSFVTDAVGRQWLQQCDSNSLCSAFGDQSSSAALQSMYGRLAANEKLRDAIPGKDPKVFFGTLLDLPSTRAQMPALIKDLTAGRDEELNAVKMRLEALGAKFTHYPQSAVSIPLVSIISISENNNRPNLTGEQITKEQEALLFASQLPSLLVNPGLPAYSRDQFFGKSPASIPRLLVLQGTLDPKTPFAGAQARIDELKRAGTVTLIPVRDAPHFILLNAPRCFESAVSSFVRQAKLDTAACTSAEREDL